MKLINFKGSKINEYIEVDIEFNEDLSILIGTNGSGKTTTIDLIQALLLPNLLELVKVPFDTIELGIEIKDENFKIQAQKKQNELIISIKRGRSFMINIHEPLVINLKVLDEFEFIKVEGFNKANSIILKKYIDNPIITFINNIQKPIFIGLERTNNDIREDYKNYLYERSIISRKFNRYSDNDNQQSLFKDHLGVSILETELLIQNVYKSFKIIQEKYFKRIQRELIASSFDFIDFDLYDLPNEVNVKEKYKIIGRRREIEESLKNIGILDKAISTKLNIFFDKIDKLFEPNADLENKGVTIEWLLNKAQVDRLIKIVNIIDEYNSTNSETFKPVYKFLNICNTFFKDTGKKLIVDEVGRLFINKPYGRQLTVDELSSGERQLIILFANVIFNKLKASNKNNTTEILIIDEPEISLHIRWQELFIDFLFEASNNTQFIIATHSPDIIGDHKFKTKRINKK